MGGTMGAGVGAVSSVGRDPCFPAGTPVLMADGTTRPIEDVAVGDHVACTDPDTGPPTTSTLTRPLTPAPTKSPGYRGDVKFTSYSGDVEAVVLGNDNAKAKNVPVPQEPHGMTEPNVEGLYNFIGFWVAAHNYLLLTGDASALNKVTDAQSQEDAKELGELYAKGAWLRSSTAHPFTLSLDTEQPTKGESENTYIWKCTPGFDPQASGRHRGMHSREPREPL